MQGVVGIIRGDSCVCGRKAEIPVLRGKGKRDWGLVRDRVGLSRFCESAQQELPGSPS